MINVNLLKGSIVSNGLTQGDVAEKLGITPQTFSAKMKKGVFGSDEIEKLIKILEIKDPVPIFFNTKVT